MTPYQKAAIELAYMDGDEIGDIAASAGVTVPQAEQFLREMLHPCGFIVPDDPECGGIRGCTCSCRALDTEDEDW